jgi:hypothetical protein
MQTMEREMASELALSRLVAQAAADAVEALKTLDPDAMRRAWASARAARKMGMGAA